MKKYVVRNKTTNEVLGKFDTKNQASEKLVEYITEKNDNVCSDEDDFLSTLTSRATGAMYGRRT